MLTATLRIVGGSVMLAIPRPVLDGLGMAANEKVALRIEEGRLVVEPRLKPRYTLAQLLAQCDETAPRDPELLEWDAAEPVGRETG